MGENIKPEMGDASKEMVYCSICQEHGHTDKDEDCPARETPITCLGCHQTGHIRAECKEEEEKEHGDFTANIRNIFDSDSEECESDEDVSESFCHICQVPGHETEKCTTCTICNKKGHIFLQCPEKDQEEIEILEEIEREKII